MAEPRLISDYRTVLAARLPAEIAEEVADGLEQTYRHHLAAGLDPQAAANAAVAEFGAAETITAAIAAISPARRVARILLAAGPLVGGCWALALISARAWTWPVPVLARLAFGATLIVVIALLAVAAFAARYRTSERTAAAALIGLVVLDLTLPGALVLPGVLHGWPVAPAAVLSLVRATFAARAWRRIRSV